MLTRTECAMMRAIAITSIVLHNYCHWLGPMVKENEFTFSIVNVRRILVEISHPSWELIAHLFSFFGHYGVPVFVFLSAYGLVKKYESTADSKVSDSGAWMFMKTHFVKLFSMMIVGYVAFVLIDYMTPGPHHYQFWNIIGQLGMFNNLYSDPDHDIWPGPYWYFGLTLQLYIVYRFVFYPGKTSLAGVSRWIQHPIVLVGIMLAFMFVQLLFPPESEQMNWYRYNCFGHIPEFIFGLLYARFNFTHFIEGKKLHCGVALLCLALVVVCSQICVLWLIVPFFIILSTISFVKIMPSSAVETVTWIGGLSSAMFVCHPITRKILIPISRRGDMFAGLILYVAATIVLAMLFKHLISFRKSSHQ